MSYQESILIPLSLFKKCKLDEISEPVTSQKILNNPTLSSSEKMKLFYQQKLLEKESKLPQYDNTPPALNYSFAESVPDKYKPYAKSILDFMSKHPQVVSWNNEGVLTINGVVYPMSDLGKTLQYFTKTLTVTRVDDIPPGSHELLTTLYGLGMPKSWLQIKPRPTRSSDRIKPAALWEMFTPAPTARPKRKKSTPQSKRAKRKLYS